MDSNRHRGSSPKAVTSAGSANCAAKVTLVNGPIYRGQVWNADGLVHVRQPDGHVWAFGPRAVYSVDFGQVPR
jgi:hypothetical protein